jgi:hypothetical protein
VKTTLGKRHKVHRRSKKHTVARSWGEALELLNGQPCSVKGVEGILVIHDPYGMNPAILHRPTGRGRGMQGYRRYVQEATRLGWKDPLHPEIELDRFPGDVFRCLKKNRIALGGG